MGVVQLAQIISTPPYLRQVLFCPDIEVSNYKNTSRHYYVWHLVKKCLGIWKVMESIANEHTPKLSKVW